MKKKAMALVLALGLVTVGIVSGTMAWLTASSTEVQNTFTDSDINITLTESDTDSNEEGIQHNYKMIPGHTITKDPKVTIKEGSEPCWLFVQVIEDLGSWADNATAADPDNTFKDYLDYAVITDGEKKWTQGNGSEIPTNVYYIKVESATSTDAEYPILVENKVTVDGDNVTKAMMDEIDDEAEAKPTLTFQAYAVQLYTGAKDENGTRVEFTADQAWVKANGIANS